MGDPRLRRAVYVQTQVHPHGGARAPHGQLERSLKRKGTGPVRALRGPPGEATRRATPPPGLGAAFRPSVPLPKSDCLRKYKNFPAFL